MYGGWLHSVLARGSSETSDQDHGLQQPLWERPVLLDIWCVAGLLAQCPPQPHFCVSAYYSLSVPCDCFLSCHFFVFYFCLMLQSLNK